MIFLNLHNIHPLLLKFEKISIYLRTHISSFQNQLPLMIPILTNFYSKHFLYLILNCFRYLSKNNLTIFLDT
jgi:hypothetical protein